MTRPPAAWLLGFALAAAAAVLTYQWCPGCLPRDRFNKTCEWTERTGGVLDLRSADGRRHLVEDAQLAEELGIRHADAEAGRRFGVEHHGGLTDNGRVRRDCLAQMFQAVETTHGVTADEVRLARGERNPVFDTLVALMFLPFYLRAAAAVCRRLGRRFEPNESLARWIATALASLAVALLGSQCFRLFGGVWEVIRVGNGHMTSIRAASANAWVHQYPAADIISGLLLFWVVAVVSSRSPVDVSQPSDAQGPRTILQG